MLAPDRSKPFVATARDEAPGAFVGLSDGVTHYQLTGPPDGRAVVLVPGYSVPLAVWDPTAAPLVDAGLRVLRYDLFGRGYSDRPETTYDRDLFDRQLAELLDALGLDRVDLVGLSMGGAIAATFAARHPAAVRRLCLIDPAGLPWKQGLTARLVHVPVLGEAIMRWLGDRVLASRLVDYFHGEGADPDLVRAFRRQLAFAGFKGALLSTVRSGVTTDAEDAYRAIGSSELPVLLIWGRQDRVVPFELSASLRERVPQAELHAIERAAHVPHYQRPDIVNPILIDFLRA